ncbi:GEVED domain-containing protein [Denitratimonas sp. CY0512]|uniref:DUF7933 domain-containing protein n=1 Tax=Denitratimonas sp. CY0512 TaxID=3131940 RepID=UPI0030B02C2A
MTSFDFRLNVYDDDGAGGSPGSLLAGKDLTVTPTPIAGIPFTPTFQNFDISDLGIVINDGSVYLSIEWDASTAPAGVFLANDESPATPYANGYFGTDGGPWTAFADDEDFEDNRALMIRATMPPTGPTTPGLSKAFSPTRIASDGTSELTITLNNASQPTAAVLSADLVDNLPAGLEVASPSNAATTCSGTLTAVEGSSSITLAAGAEVPAEGKCTITVDVAATADGDYVNSMAPGALQTNHGNNPNPAEATLGVGFVFPEPYCEVTFSFSVEPISRVLFTGIDNTSSAVLDGSPAHEDFLSVTGGEVMQGFSYPAAVEGNTGGNYTNKVTVYIDWNQDGVFSETTEAYQLTDLYGSTGTDNQQAIGDIEVPVDAVPGETRMRVVKNYSSAPTSCLAGSFGQAEDYTLTVNALPEYTVTPSVGAGDGTISPDTAQLVTQGSTATFTLVAGAGNVIDNVDGTCGGTLTDDTFVTDPVTEDCTVIANFKAAAVTVAKSFDPATITELEQSTAIITLTNRLTVDATLTAPFVDQLPTGLNVTSATTTCGMILTGGEGENTISATQFGLPAGIVLAADSSCEIRATIVPDVAGTYVNEIAAGDLQTDQGSNTEGAEATLVVTGFPTIDVSEDSLSSTLVTNTTDTQSLDISNIGTGDLVWNITEAGALNANPPSFRNVTRIGSSAGAALTSGTSLGLRGSGAPVILAPTDISQMEDNSPGDQGVSCGTTGASTADNSWWRRFYFNEHPEVGSAATVTSVTISTGSIDIPGGLPTTINLYTIPSSTTVDTIPTAALTLIGTTTTTVSGALASVTIPVTGVISDTVATDLVVEWYTDGSDDGQFFPGANATPETHPTFISSATCSIDQPTPASAINFPDFHLTMVVSVESGGSACASPVDLPWLSVNPTSGTTGAGGSDSVDVTFDATGMPPGTYEGELCINSNDEENPLVSVPVEMVVNPSGVTFEVTPSVNGANGTISPNTVQTVDENGLVTFTLTPDFGYGVGTMGGTCPGTLSGNTYIAGPVTADCTVEAQFVELPFPAPYCNVTFPSDVEPISRVVFSGIDNESDPAVGGSPALEDFRAVTGGDVSLGGVYSIAVEGNTGGNFTTRIRAYIDWNRDGVFDASEGYVLTDLVGSTGTDGKQSTGEITVPEGALLGETRMRVIKKFSSVPEPCNTAGYGQAEDYTIVINDDPLPQPEIDLDKFALNITAMAGTTGTDTLQISNVGEAGSRLEYQIRRALAGPAAVTQADMRRNTGTNDAAKFDPSAPAQASAHHDLKSDAAAYHTPPATVSNVVFANDPSCQVGTPGLVVHDGNGAPDNGYGWNASAGTDPKYVDKFTPSSYPATYTTVCVSLLTNAGVTSAPVVVVVFADDGPGGAPGTELGRVNATANNITAALEQSFQAIDISEMGLEITEGSVYIGLEWDATSIAGLYIASDETSSANAGGYSYSSGEWTPIIDGFEEYKSLFVRAIEDQAGPPGIGCENPSNVSWLSVTPASGTIMDGDSQTVTVTGNATGMAPGSYEALICVNSNDTEYPRIDLTVTMEVTAQPPAIFSDGFEGDDPPPEPEIVVGQINTTIDAGGDITYDFVTQTLDTWDPNRVDDINLYDYGDGSLTVYWFGDAASLDVGGVVDGDGVEFAVLQPGDTIGPASPISAASLKLVNWNGNVDGYIGFAFENEETGKLNYGYLRVVSSGATGLPAQVIEYGYNKAGNAITIPTP